MLPGRSPAAAQPDAEPAESAPLQKGSRRSERKVSALLLSGHPLRAGQPSSSCPAWGVSRPRIRRLEADDQIKQLGVPSEVDRRTNTNGRRNVVQTKATRQIGETGTTASKTRETGNQPRQDGRRGRHEPIAIPLAQQGRRQPEINADEGKNAWKTLHGTHRKSWRVRRSLVGAQR